MEVEFVQKRFQFVGRFVLVQPLQFEDGSDVVFYGELAEDAGFLGQVPDAFLGADVHGVSGQVVVPQSDRASVGSNQPHHCVKARGLAGPVGPQQPHDLAGRNAEGHVVDDGAFAVNLHKVVGDEV